MLDRRDFMRLAAGGGGAVFLSGLYGSVRAGVTAAPGTSDAAAASAATPYEDFYFVQLSDMHWGYVGDANPEASTTFKRAIDAVNALRIAPDFIVFTGDLTHTTDDPAQRRKRMAEVKQMTAALQVKTLHFLPGEHDASLDNGMAFKEYFGPTNYAFDHKGVHFIALDNVSDPGARLGQPQLDWLKAELARHDPQSRIVILTHRPLFDLVPKWDWATRDGAQAVALLMPYTNVTVFYGHIHQENHHMTGHIAHHAAKSLIFPLPAPGSQEKRTPLPWDPAAPGKGLGFREVKAERAEADLAMTEFSLQRT